MYTDHRLEEITPFVTGVKSYDIYVQLKEITPIVSVLKHQSKGNQRSIRSCYYD